MNCYGCLFHRVRSKNCECLHWLGFFLLQNKHNFFGDHDNGLAPVNPYQSNLIIREKNSVK